jgi:hypothetical protein
VPLPAAQARGLEADTRSGQAGEVRKALDIPAKRKVDPGLVRELASLRSLRVDERGFVQRDDHSATVPITTTAADGTTTTWTATLVLVGGTWRIALTEPVNR